MDANIASDRRELLPPALVPPRDDAVACSVLSLSDVDAPPGTQCQADWS
jgi:hypothetical protein